MGTDSERPESTSMVEFSHRVVVPPHVLIRHMGGEAVLLNLDTEKYFGLEPTAARMWDAATRSPNIEAAYRLLVEEFDVEPGVLRQHLEELLVQLIENGLLKVLPPDVESLPAL